MIFFFRPGVLEKLKLGPEFLGEDMAFNIVSRN